MPRVSFRLYGGCCALSRRPFFFSYYFLLLSTHLSISACTPSIHPADHELLSYIQQPFALLLTLPDVCQSCWCWIIDAQLLRRHQKTPCAHQLPMDVVSYYMHSIQQHKSRLYSSMSCSIHLFPSFDSDRQGKRIDDHRWLVKRSILVDTSNE